MDNNINDKTIQLKNTTKQCATTAYYVINDNQIVIPNNNINYNKQIYHGIAKSKCIKYCSINMVFFFLFKNLKKL